MKGSANDRVQCVRTNATRSLQVTDGYDIVGEDLRCKGLLLTVYGLVGEAYCNVCQRTCRIGLVQLDDYLS